MKVRIYLQHIHEPWLQSTLDYVEVPSLRDGFILARKYKPKNNFLVRVEEAWLIRYWLHRLAMWLFVKVSEETK